MPEGLAARVAQVPADVAPAPARVRRVLEWVGFGVPFAGAVAALILLVVLPLARLPRMVERVPAGGAAFDPAHPSGGFVEVIGLNLPSGSPFAILIVGWIVAMIPWTIYRVRQGATVREALTARFVGAQRTWYWLIAMSLAVLLAGTSRLPLQLGVTSIPWAWLLPLVSLLALTGLGRTRTIRRTRVVIGIAAAFGVTFVIVWAGNPVGIGSAYEPGAGWARSLVGERVIAGSGDSVPSEGHLILRREVFELTPDQGFTASVSIRNTSLLPITIVGLDPSDPFFMAGTAHLAGPGWYLTGLGLSPGPGEPRRATRTRHGVPSGGRCPGRRGNSGDRGRGVRVRRSHGLVAAVG